MEKLKNYVLTRRWLFTFIIIITGIVFVSILSVLANNNHILSNEKLENMYYSAQIITSLFVGAGVLIAGWQYVVTTRTEMKSVNIIQIQKAIDLAAFYKDHVLKMYIAVHYVYENGGIIDILNSIDTKKMRNFDTIELNKLLPESKQNELKKLQHSDKFIKAVFNANEIYGLNLQLQKTIAKDAHNNVTISYDKSQIVSAFMSSILTNMLNDMEFFSLHFSHNTADDSVVYQSLHQTYLDIVQLSYYNISHCNTNGQPAYYTNITELYRKWFDRQQLQLEEIASGSRNSKFVGNTVSSTL